MIRFDFSKLDAWIEGAEKALEKAPEQIAEILRNDAKRQFAMGGDPAWQPLSPETIREKGMAGYPRLTRKGLVPASALQNETFASSNVLMRTMALYNSWTAKDDPNHVEEVSGEGVFIGSSLVYAATHQYGDTRVAWGKHLVNYPSRPVRVTETAQRAISAFIEANFQEGK